MLKKICGLIRKKSSEKGQGVVEYALMLGFVAVITVGLFGGEDGGLMEVFKTTLRDILDKFR